jgi:hypothetical protein
MDIYKINTRLTPAKKQISLVLFLLNYDNKWHSFENHHETIGFVCATANLGILKVNEYNQMKLKSKPHALQYLNSKIEYMGAKQKRDLHEIDS